MMLFSERHLLTARVSTLLGSLLLASWALGAGMLIWHVSFDTDPLERLLLTKTLF